MAGQRTSHYTPDLGMSEKMARNLEISEKREPDLAMNAKRVKYLTFNELLL